MSTEVETSLKFFLIGNIKRFDSLNSRSLSLRPARLSRGFPAAPFSTALGMTNSSGQHSPLDFLRGLRIKNAVEIYA
jgi:hypothetical protein